MTEFLRDRSAFNTRAQQRLLQKTPELGSGKSGSKAAAVLIPVVAGEGELTVLLTQRGEDLPDHPGQIAFPGGKIDPQDASPLAAALRETHEETGIAAEFVMPVGYLAPLETGTGFYIVPVVGLLSRGFELVPEPGEVSDIFEVPLAFLMNPANHRQEEIMWKGEMREYTAMPYEDRFIWGATARMLVDLHKAMSGDD